MAAVTALALVLFAPAQAKADHVGPFVYNAADARVVVDIEGHPGQNGYFYYLYPGQHSDRGATRVYDDPVAYGDRAIRIQSIATGRIYTSPCGGSIQIGNGDGTGNSAKVIAVIPCG